MSNTQTVMLCPLCGAALTAKDRSFDSRYHCPACAPTSAEAKKGWLATGRVAVAPQAEPAKGLTSLATVMRNDKMFAQDSSGGQVTRESTCECGKQFMQHLISPRFMEIVERAGPRALAAMKVMIPDYFVPVHCPPCERKDLSFAARRSELQHYSQQAAD